MKHTILIVDDEASLRQAMERYLRGEGYRVVSAASGAEAVERIAEGPVDLAVIDVVMGDMDGVECLRRLRAEQPDCVAIMMSGYGTIAGAVDAMRAGAYHYAVKPFAIADLGRLVATALTYRHARVETRQRRRPLDPPRRDVRFIGRSEPMLRVTALIDKVAATDSTVLILGESGTGKELVARAIHYGSARADRPLVTVNCAAIPEELLESELFGHMKGAFTGAVGDHPGRFAAAHGGTIFLDEIGDMSPKLQVKILRVLQERRFEPVGSTQPIDVDVRIIAATNQDLDRAVKERRFRDDLYYRLNVIPVKLPPLRERRADIPLLCRHFIAVTGPGNGKEAPLLTDEAIRCLMRYDWPGNVRELENTLERLMILKGSGRIGPGDLPAKMRNGESPFRAPEVEIPDAGLSLRTVVNAFENELILRALQKTGWNKNRAASLLRLNRTTLVEKIKKKQLEKGAAN